MYNVNVEYDEKCELSFLGMKARVFIYAINKRYEGNILDIPETISFCAETMGCA